MWKKRKAREKSQTGQTIDDDDNALTPNTYEVFHSTGVQDAI